VDSHFHRALADSELGGGVGLIGVAGTLIADTHFFVGTEQTSLELPLMKLMFDGGARDRYG
jgi:hypothetical protein